MGQLAWHKARGKNVLKWKQTTFQPIAFPLLVKTTGSLSIFLSTTTQGKYLLFINLVLNWDEKADSNDAHQSAFIFPRDFVLTGRQKQGL